MRKSIILLICLTLGVTQIQAQTKQVSEELISEFFAKDWLCCDGTMYNKLPTRSCAELLAENQESNQTILLSHKRYVTKELFDSGKTADRIVATWRGQKFYPSAKNLEAGLCHARDMEFYNARALSISEIRAICLDGITCIDPVFSFAFNADSTLLYATVLGSKKSTCDKTVTIPIPKGYSQVIADEIQFESLTICRGSEDEWRGIVIDSAGTYRSDELLPDGRKRIHHLLVNELAPTYSQSSLQVTVGDSIVLDDQLVIKTDTSIQQTLEANNGCDSIVTMSFAFIPARIDTIMPIDSTCYFCDENQRNTGGIQVGLGLNYMQLLDYKGQEVLFEKKFIPTFSVGYEHYFKEGRGLFFGKKECIVESVYGMIGIQSTPARFIVDPTGCNCDNEPKIGAITQFFKVGYTATITRYYPFTISVGAGVGVYRSKSDIPESFVGENISSIAIQPEFIPQLAYQISDRLKGTFGASIPLIRNESLRFYPHIGLVFNTGTMKSGKKPRKNRR